MHAARLFRTTLYARSPFSATAGLPVALILLFLYLQWSNESEACQMLALSRLPGIIPSSYVTLGSRSFLLVVGALQNF